jgi:predicted phosphodiesterase
MAQRVVRRLVVHMLAKLAPYAGSVIVETVPGNHDQQRKDRVTPASDSWAIEAISAAQDALELSGQYEHVSFAYPRGSEDVSVAVDVDGVVIGAVHGDQFSSPDRMRQWWAGQALAGAEVGSAQILLSGHFHHLRVESISKTKTWFQVPALDNGSPWFKNRKGADAPAGMISFRLEKSAPYWSALQLHTGAVAS